MRMLSRAGIQPSLALIRDAMAPELFSSESLRSLNELSTHLPPVQRAGFECRLDAGSTQVDLQQGFLPSSWEAQAVAQFAEACVAASTGALREAWMIVGELCRECLVEDSAIADATAEVWLEYDVVDDADDSEAQPFSQLAPSVFVVLHHGKLPAAEYVRMLLPSAEAAQMRVLIERWSSIAAQYGAEIQHLGVMLGRSPAGVRVHVSGLPYRHLESFLHAIPWRGDVSAAVASAGHLFDFVDQVVLCFDIACTTAGTFVLPRLGLEGFFEQKSGIDPRWEPLLESLVQRGLASGDKARAVQQWPGHYTPMSAGSMWPESLIIRSLVKPESTFGHVERRLSHVKISVADGQPASAKVYFGFGHLWKDVRVNARGAMIESISDGATGGATTPVAVTASPVAPVEVDTSQRAVGRAFANALSNTIESAERFLLSHRNQAGWWRDFFDLGRSAELGRRVTGYASDEWVSAYIGTMLAESSRESGMQAARETWALLKNRRGSEDGWGYHAQLPPDSDSTTWALRLARAVGQSPDSRMQHARLFIARQTNADGGVHCYRAEDCESIATFLRMAGPYDGWCASHVCITAAVASLSLDSAHLAHVRSAQRPDGRWMGHWWDDDEYATAMATAVLSDVGASVDAPLRCAAATWAASRMGASGAVHSQALGTDSAFATALALNTIVYGDDERRHRDAVIRSTRWLRDAQRPDGSFAPSARLRVPAPSAVDPLQEPATTLSYLDRNACFTTATVYAALALVQRASERYSLGD
ncbi:MAG: prenyltransferase/squalene oxidase repeat-containing protein [Gemmatimonas sp.]